MRILARFGLGLCGVVLGVGSAARADDTPAPPESRRRPEAQAPGIITRACSAGGIASSASGAWAKKHDGVDVPPPPSTLPAGVIPGQVVHDHGTAATCSACEAGAVVTGPVTIVESLRPDTRSWAGRRWLELPARLCGSWTGGPGDGRWQTRLRSAWRERASRAGNGPRMAAGGPRPGSSPYDPAVMPSSMIPAQTALDSPTAAGPT